MKVNVLVNSYFSSGGVGGVTLIACDFSKDLHKSQAINGAPAMNRRGNCISSIKYN